MSSDITGKMDVETAQGEKITIEKLEDGKVVVTGSECLPVATVISADNVASNGVAHVIDNVLLPPSICTIVQQMAAATATTSTTTTTEAPAPAPAAGTDKEA